MVLFKKCILVIMLMLFISCRNNIVEYEVGISDKNPIIQLNSWHILGPIKNSDPTLHSNFLDKDHLDMIGVPDSLFCRDPFSLEIDIPKMLQVGNTFFNDIYHSKESIIDFNQIKKTDKNDSLIRGSAIYFYCNIKSMNNVNIYLLTRSSNGIRVWLNSKMIYSSNENKGFELTFSEYIPLHLKKGNNYLVIKKINLSNEVLFEGILCNKDTMIKQYSKSTTGLILYPSIITNNTLCFARNHQQVLDTVLSLSIYSLKDDSTFSYDLKSLSTRLSISNLEDNCSYYACFKIGDQVFSQPFYKGNPDEALNRFLQKQSRINNNALLIQADALIYRLKALLNHESRKDDWWWQLKVSSVIYELDNLYQNFSNKDQFMLHSSGIQMKAYLSKLDNTIQYYLLITPDKMTSAGKIPLVLVMRPYIENHHHFLTSPQMARYWSLTNAKYLANKYHYAIIMPAGRLYSNEELIPMAEIETIQALNDVQQYCNVDINKIYLHGNCLAGYRCLSLACRYPNKFAAIGLYAPIYRAISKNEWIIRNSPKNNINNLREIPIMLHFDPLDSHTPYIELESLIDDCGKNKVNISLSSSTHSGLHYNVLLVGEEAFSFFQGKERAVSSRRKEEKKIIREKIIADLFSQPFVFVYDSSNKSEQYKQVVDSIKNEYEDYFFSKIPLITSDSLNLQSIINKNIFFIGHKFNNQEIKNLISKLPLIIGHNHIRVDGKNYNIDHCMFQVILDNPYNKNKSIVVYSSNTTDDLSHIIKTPWKDSLVKCIILRKE